MKIPILMMIALGILVVAIARQYLFWTVILPNARKGGFAGQGLRKVLGPGGALSAYRQSAIEQGQSVTTLRLYLGLFVVEVVLIAGWIAVAILVPGRVF